jgi:hypothetical protein
MLRIGPVILIASAWMGFGSLEAITQDVVLLVAEEEVTHRIVGLEDVHPVVVVVVGGSNLASKYFLLPPPQ